MISVVRMTAASARWEAVEGRSHRALGDAGRVGGLLSIGTWRGLCRCSGAGQVKRILVPETVLWR